MSSIVEYLFSDEEPTTGQIFAEKEKLEWLQQNGLSFKDDEVIWGLKMILIPTPNSGVEAKGLKAKISKIGADILALDNIIYVAIPRKSKFSLLTQGLMNINFALSMYFAAKYIYLYIS